MTAIEFQGVSKSFHRNTGRLPLRNRVANWFRLERRDDGAPGAPEPAAKWSRIDSGTMLSDAARNQLEQIANLKQQVAAAGREKQSLESQITGVVADQERVRQNIGRLNQVTGQQQQVQAYAQRLSGQ